MGTLNWTLVNGWPAGSAGSACPGSTRLDSSAMVGRRHPLRPPTAFLGQPDAAWRRFRRVDSGERSHTRPVSRSRTACPVKLERTMNRAGTGRVRVHDAVTENGPFAVVWACAEPLSPDSGPSAKSPKVNLN